MPMCIKMSTFMGREKKRKPKSLLEMDSAVIFIKRNQTKLKLCVKNLPTSSACNKHPRTGQKQEFFRHRRVKQNKKPKKKQENSKEMEDRPGYRRQEHIQHYLFAEALLPVKSQSNIHDGHGSQYYRYNCRWSIQHAEQYMSYPSIFIQLYICISIKFEFFYFPLNDV